MGDYFTDVVNIDKQERIKIEELGEFQKWSYKFGLYGNSLVLIAVGWMTVWPNQKGSLGTRFPTQGRWVGDQVMFFHDGDATLEAGHGLPWEPMEIKEERSQYKDISLDVFSDLCESGTNPLPKLLAKLCLDEIQGNTTFRFQVIRRFVADLLAHRNNPKLEKELQDLGLD